MNDMRLVAHDPRNGHERPNRSLNVGRTAVAVALSSRRYPVGRSPPSGQAGIRTSGTNPEPGPRAARSETAPG